MAARAWLWAWLALVVVRLVMVLAPGYPHPDEWFQSPEVAADGLGLQALVPWEFTAAHACRSIVPTIVSAVPLSVMRVLNCGSGLGLLVGPRMVVVTLSLLLDLAVAQASWKSGVEAGPALVAFAGSWPTLVFLVRPFSNTLEALALALALVFHLCIREREGWERRAALGAVAAIGLFTRFTFCMFLFPIALAQLAELLLWPHLGLRSPPLSARAQSLAKGSLIGFSGVIVTSLLFIVADSLYFGSWQLTVWNSLSYNLDPNNLAEHGLHPRWLHALVNMPLLFLPILLGALFSLPSILSNLWPWEVRTVRRRRSRVAMDSTLSHFAVTKRMTRRSLVKERPDDSLVPLLPPVPLLLVAVVLSGCGLLSVAQHQEPRFLLPLAVPLAALAQQWMRRRWFLALFVAFNVAGLLFFGFLHQGGVVPSLLSANSSVGSGEFAGSALQGDGRSLLVYYATFMPPRYLLGQSANSPVVSLLDAAGDEAKLEQFVNSACDFASNVFLLAPATVTLPHTVAAMAEESFLSFGPHFSSENPPWESKLPLGQALRLLVRRINC